jgi:hypothetical protein
MRKQKLIATYELKIVLGWKGSAKAAGGAPVSGKVTLPYVSEVLQDMRQYTTACCRACQVASISGVGVLQVQPSHMEMTSRCRACEVESLVALARFATWTAARKANLTARA